MFEKCCSVVVLVVWAMALSAVMCLVAAIPTYFLWNWLMPEIFGLKVLTFWQAWGLGFLCAIHFKGNTSFKSKD